MAQDLYFNGTRYPDRNAGASSYGTHYGNIKPIDSGPTTRYTPTLYSLWGSRLAESTARVRGISGVATMTLSKINPVHNLAEHGTAVIEFPPAYFTQQPIVKAMVLERAWFDKPRLGFYMSIGNPITGENDFYEQGFYNAEYGFGELMWCEPATNIWWTAGVNPWYQWWDSAAPNYGDPRRIDGALGAGGDGFILKNQVVPIIFVCKVGTLGMTVISQRQAQHLGWTHKAAGRGLEYEYIAWHAFGI